MDANSTKDPATPDSKCLVGTVLDVMRTEPALEAVKLAAELGVDINAANTDGRTALDAANGLRYESVAQFLTAKGGKASGKPAPREAVAD